ncbi:hypothetical protein SDC9_107621 [bioreactor metagenome]|uniref:Uncharacterized protein n=1 Tax=bioreactor metagenome TaxID=1076179 RepID=A0A645B5U1_9ZZZZ
MPRSQNRHAVFADAAADDDFVTRGKTFPPERKHRMAEADAGGVDIQPVARALRHHLGIAGHDRHVARLRRRRRRVENPAQLRQREMFFDNQAQSEIAGNASGHPDIVDRADHGEFANVAARKKARRNHETVG